MNTEFIFAKEEDLPSIVATYNETVAGRMVTADTEPVSVEDKKEWFHKHNEVDRPLWILRQNGEYAGWMSFNSFYGRPAYSGTVEVSIYLENKFRGVGLGAKCLSYAIEKAPQCKVHTILGFIFGHNEVSLRLFKKFGFAEWANLPGVAILDGINRDLIILGRKV